VSSNPVPRIFVVDDEPVIASTLAAILQMNGFSAKFFTCPLDALAAARLKAPDLLISDVAMPGISGIDLAIQMKAQYPTCKVLLFSGQAATMDLLEDARAQGHDFDLLLKPLPPTEFLLEVGKMVNATSQTTAARPVRSSWIAAASFPLAQAASNWNGTTGQTRKPAGIEAGKAELCLTSMV
jgi:DNA-binding NtrC family response regulator